MRRIHLLVLMMLMTIVACKKTPDNSGPEDDPKGPDTGVPPAAEANTLPERIVMTAGGETRTFTVTYLGNTKKIDKISEKDGREQKYTYNEDLIAKQYLGTDESTSDHYDVYEYDKGKLTKMDSYRGLRNTDVAEFTYSGAKMQAKFKENNNNVWEEGLQVLFNYDGKGNLIDAELSTEGTSAGHASITYDDNNSPFVNVLGWGKIRYTGGAPLGDNIGFEDIMGIRNNPKKLTGRMMGDNVEVAYTYEFKDVRNPKFPTKIAGTKKAGTDKSTFTAEITYK